MFTEETLKKQWKYLKDQFRKELKKKTILRSGAESEAWQSTWQYFNLMSFMKDEVIPSPTTGNLESNNPSNSQTNIQEYSQATEDGNELLDLD